MLVICIYTRRRRGRTQETVTRVTMDQRTLVRTLLNIGKRYTIACDDLNLLITKICIISLKYINREQLFEEFYGSPDDDEDEEEKEEDSEARDKPASNQKSFVDWDLLYRLKTDNVLGGITSWISLLDFMSWKHLEGKESEIAKKYPILNKLRNQIQEVGLDPGKDDEAWTLTCKIKMLMMIMHLPTLKAIDVYTCAVFKKSTTTKCMQLLSLQSEMLYTPQEQLEIMYFILKEVKINTDTLKQTWNVILLQQQEVKLVLEQQRMQVIHGRPRLRDRLDKARRVHSTLNTWETYTGFCYRHQFPPTLSENVKSKLYFMASQTQWKWQDYLHVIIPGASMITQKVAEYPVTQPDLPHIIKVIESLNMDGHKPFVSLNNFRSKCFTSFPVSHVEQLTFTQFLQLYVTVYLPPSIWKDVWKHVIGVISVQIIRDCENFAAQNAFDAKSFMELF